MFQSAVYVGDGLGESPQSLLRQVVPDAARDAPMRVLARELCPMRAGIGMGRTIGITFEGDCWHGDLGAAGELLFQILVSCLAR